MFKFGLFGAHSLVFLGFLQLNSPRSNLLSGLLLAILLNKFLELGCENLELLFEFLVLTLECGDNKLFFCHGSAARGVHSHRLGNRGHTLSRVAGLLGKRRILFFELVVSQTIVLVFFLLLVLAGSQLDEMLTFRFCDINIIIFNW